MFSYSIFLFFFKYCSVCTAHKMKLKKTYFFFLSLIKYEFKIGIVTVRTSLIQYSITYTQIILLYYLELYLFKMGKNYKTILLQTFWAYFGSLL